MNVGKPADRIDGVAKVTGRAKYASDYSHSNLAHAVLVQSTIGNGRINKIDAAGAERSPGVLLVMTHENTPPVGPPTPYMAGQSFMPLGDDVIRYNGQHIAVVVAETLVQATHAAEQISVEYDELPTVFGLDTVGEELFVPPPSWWGGNEWSRGDPAAGLASADVTVDVTYRTPMMHHNPMEPSATTAIWEGDSLTVYDSTTSISLTQHVLSDVLRIPASRVRVICQHLGGGFGCKGYVWPHTMLAALAAREVGRPVKLTLTRTQMFTAHGHRPEFMERLRLGAVTDGRLTAIVHSDASPTPVYEDVPANTTDAVAALYACDNVSAELRLGRMNIMSATPMRGPTGVALFFLECAMDELSYALSMDPLELRRRNHAEVDPRDGSAWNGKHLLECYDAAAEAFGWADRPAEVRAMRAGDDLVGWGMATDFHGWRAYPASASVRLLADGTAIAAAGTQDVGTGTRTVLSQVAADALCLPHRAVTFELGDSNLPTAPLSASSGTVVSMTGPVRDAALAAFARLVRLAVTDERSPLFGLGESEVAAEGGRLHARHDPHRGETYAAVLGRSTELIHTVASDPGGQAGFAFGAVFAEVRVSQLGEVRVTRVVSARDIGRVVNPKLARSQAIGGVIWGLGLSVMEHTRTDNRTGRMLSRSLSTALVPVHADVPAIETLFIDDPSGGDRALGVRGAGDGPIGTAAAIANAVYHATGRRVRELPITPERLL